jgi:hypothetical protein
MGDCEYGLMLGCCESGNERSDSIKRWNYFLISRVITILPKMPVLHGEHDVFIYNIILQILVVTGNTYMSISNVLV